MNCSDVQSVHTSDKADDATDVHSTTTCERRHDFEQQDLRRLRRVTVDRRLHVTAAVHSTTRHFCQRAEEPV